MRRRCCAWRRRPRRPAAIPLAAAVVEEARRRSLGLLEAARRRRSCPARACRPAARRAVASRTRSWSATGGCSPSTGSSWTPSADGVLGRLDAQGETALFVAVDGAVAGVIGVHDAVRPEAHDVIHDLRHLKITRDRDPDRRPRAGRAGGGEEDARRHRRGRAAAGRQGPLDRGAPRRPAARWRWSATASTMPRRWPRPTPGSPWAASAPTWPPRPAT